MDIWVPATDEDRRGHAAIFGEKEGAGLIGWLNGAPVVEIDEIPDELNPE